MSSQASVSSQPEKKDENDKPFWCKYGKLIAVLGFGSAFIFLMVIIYLLMTRTSVPPTTEPALAQMSPEMQGGRGWKRRMRGRGAACGMTGGCGCTGISQPN
jgi:hypothetical protein